MRRTFVITASIDSPIWEKLILIELEEEPTINHLDTNTLIISVFTTQDVNNLKTLIKKTPRVTILDLEKIN